MTRRLRENEIDELLAEAVDVETFRNLPGYGEPITIDDGGPGWWARRKADELRRAEASSSHAVKEDLRSIWAMTDAEKAEVALNELAARLEERAIHLDVGAVLSRWKRTH